MSDLVAVSGADGATALPRLTRVRRLFGIDVGWVRPVDRRRAVRSDVLGAAVFAVYALLSLETARSLGSLAQVSVGEVWQALWIGVPALTLAVRRVVPLTVLGFATAHLALTALLEPALSPVFAIQVYYFFVLFTAIAWSPHRRRVLRMTSLFAVTALLFVAVELVVRDGLDPLGQLPDLGLLSPTQAAVVQIVLSSAVFVAASVVGGTVTWWGAHREADALALADTIATQAERLRARAIDEERLRIARELHDVVGHHLAVVGIHSGVARRAVGRDPAEATESMLQVEESAREATGDLRRLLDALRVRGDEAAARGGGLHPVGTGLAATGRHFAKVGLEVEVHTEGAVDEVPAGVGIALDRIVTESLTNVTRHSTARNARVSVRATGHAGGPGEIRVVVADDGVARGGTTGSGVGIMGMRERVALHGGSLQASPGPDGGFVVEAVLAWSSEEES